MTMTTVLSLVLASSLLAVILWMSSRKLSESSGPNQKKYEWIATESAPKNYPAYMLMSYFELVDGNIQAIPSDRVTNTGWGKRGGVVLIGDAKKAAPKTLHIKWFDLVTRKGYGGEIKLDPEKMEMVLRNGFPSLDGETPYRTDAIIVGVASNGVVGLWAGGEQVQHLLSMHQVPEINIPLNEMSNNPEDSEETFVQMYLSLLKIDTKLAPPDGFWNDLENRYPYTPIVMGEFKGDYLRIDFVNGEIDWFDISKKRVAPSSVASPGLAIPEEATFTWLGPTGIKFAAKVDFDVEEVRLVMESFQNKIKKESIILELRPNETTSRVDVTLRAGEKSLLLEKVQTWVYKF